MKNFPFYVKSSLTLLIILIINLPTRIQADDKNLTVDDVIEKYRSALGGKETILKIESRFVQGYLVKDLYWNDPPYDVVEFVAYSKAPDKVLITFYEDTGDRINGYDGENGWQRNYEGIKTDENISKPKLSWILNPQNVLNLDKYYSKLEYTGTEWVNDRLAYVIESPDYNKEHYGLYIDVESGLLIRIGYGWEIKDYKQIDGVMVPTRIIQSRKGGSYTYKIKEVRNNIPVDDSMFTIPSQSP